MSVAGFGVAGFDAGFGFVVGFVVGFVAAVGLAVVLVAEVVGGLGVAGFFETDGLAVPDVVLVGGLVVVGGFLAVLVGVVVLLLSRRTEDWVVAADGAGLRTCERAVSFLGATPVFGEVAGTSVSFQSWICSTESSVEPARGERG